MTFTDVACTDPAQAMDIGEIEETIYIPIEQPTAEPSTVPDFFPEEWMDPATPGAPTAVPEPEKAPSPA